MISESNRRKRRTRRETGPASREGAKNAKGTDADTNYANDRELVVHRCRDAATHPNRFRMNVDLIHATPDPQPANRQVRPTEFNFPICAYLCNPWLNTILPRCRAESESISK